MEPESVEPESDAAVGLSRSRLPSSRRLLAAFIALVGFAAILYLAGHRPPRALRATFLDVAQGDAIYLSTPGGHTLLVDSGRSTPDDDMGRRVVVPFLRAQGVRRLDALVLTHPDDSPRGQGRKRLFTQFHNC